MFVSVLDVWIRLKSRFCLAPSPTGTVCLVDGTRTVVAVQDQPTAVMNAMAAVASPTGLSTLRLNEQILESGGVDALLRLEYLLSLCHEANAVYYDLRIDGETMATAVPLQNDVDLTLPDAPDRPGFVVSRFTYLRRERGRVILESPLAPVRLELLPRATAAVAQLFACNDRTPQASPTSAATMVGLRTALAHWGFLEPPDLQETPAREVWEFHDALFHSASRMTTESASTGATFRFRDRLTPWPALKPAGSNERISLVTPDLDAVSSNDGSFADVLDRRRSIRDRAATLTVDQLSQFLFRTMRVREVNTNGSVETMRRVAPAGGALHEIDAYLAVGHCMGLRTGCYRYDGSRHDLAAITSDADRVARFLDQATRSWGGRYPKPQVLVTLAARVPRVAWQYERMAYRVVLLNAGALLQTMYLVATAMHLAPCAVGNGSPALFSELTGLDPFEETSVGEFALSGSVTQ